jgi:hypothetical protein
LQLLSSNWIRNDYKIDGVEVETYLSNLRYLAEQAAFLRQVLEDQKSSETGSAHVHMSSIPVRKTAVQFPIEEPAQEIIDEPTQQVHTEETAAEEFANELSLHEKLSSQIKESSLADSLKNSFFHKDLNFSLNERFFFINELFNTDQKDFDKVVTHLATLDSWEEVEFYLNSTCYMPYAWEEKETAKNQFYEFLQKRF